VISIIRPTKHSTFFIMNSIRFAAPFLAVFLFSNCASIVSKSNWPVSVQSEKPGVEFVVKKADGSVVTSGKTPQQVTLASGNGFFKPGTYVLETHRKGKVLSTQQITATVNGWYFGNIIFGGLIGLVIVDPLTGAMYRLPETVTLSSATTASNTHHGQSLRIASIESLTQEQRAKLVRI
jgi:hypothetical protein